MAVMTEQLEAFPFIAAGHSFYPTVCQLRTAMSDRSLWAGIQGGMPREARATVHSEIKGRLLPDHGWDLDRLYWSYQWWDPRRSLQFRSVTLYYTARSGRFECYEFPQDPYLTTMLSAMPGSGSGATGGIAPVEVLRYVPLRRLTFRSVASGETGCHVVGKLKRRSRFREAYKRLATVSRAMDRSRASFSVPAPAGIDEEHCLFFQEEKPGRDVSSLLDHANLAAMLHRVGTIHRELHGQDIPAAPDWDFGAFAGDLERDVRWICLFRPDQDPFLTEVLDLLLAQPPRLNPAEYTFCHGDFVCSQILAEDRRWSVVDFDLSRRGDPYLEIAMLMASLPYDVPLIERQVSAPREGRADLLQVACEAYLDGYEAAAGAALNRKRLLWYRLCAEIYYLALRFRKDRSSATIFDRTIGLIHEISQAFRQEKAGEF